MKEPLFEQLKTDRKKSEVFSVDMKKKFYKECLDLIKSMNNINITQCMYKTPHTLIGYPTYNPDEITKYIAGKLRREKIKVKFLSKSEIFISWA